MKIITKTVGKTFSERAVALALMIPKGKVATYGDIARAAGGSGQAARSVTAILGKAYEAGEKNIAFHRIVYAGGKVWFDAHHEKKRRELYKKEQIIILPNNTIKDFESKRFLFR